MGSEDSTGLLGPRCQWYIPIATVAPLPIVLSFGLCVILLLCYVSSGLFLDLHLTLLWAMNWELTGWYQLPNLVYPLRW